MPGPGRYRLLKEYAKKQLREGFSVPAEHVHEEFPIGDVILDVVAYPSVERKGEAAIGVECGDRRTSPAETSRHFEAALAHVDLLVWFPYSAHDDGFRATTAHLDGALSVAPGEFALGGQRFAPLANTAGGNGICGLILSRRGRFPWLDDAPEESVTSAEGLAGG